MKKITLFVLFLTICLTINSGFTKENTGELLFKLKKSFNKNQKSSLINLYSKLGINNKTAYSNRVVNVFSPVDKSKSINELKTEMQDSNLFEFVELNTIEYHPKLEIADLRNTNQYHHTNIRTKMAHGLSTGKSTLVAVCDSGVESMHEDLKGILVEGWDFVDNDTDANPATSHGTFVTGLIAANIGNGVGVAGIAPDVKILPLRIANSNGGASVKIITDCIRYAADKGAKIINVSFTGVNSSSVAAAGKYAFEKGALLVYAAGNQGWNKPKWKNKKYVLAVGASTKEDQLWRYKTCGRFRCSTKGSNTGPFVDIAAPGHNMYSTTTYIEHNPGSAKYRSGSGTSYSAPVLTAVAALVASARPDLGPAQIEAILKASADKVGAQNSFGSGRVNAFEAVKLAIDY